MIQGTSYFKLGRLITKFHDKRDDFTFPLVNFPSSVAIFQHHQRMEFTMMFYACIDVFFPLSVPISLPDLTVYMSNTDVSYKKQVLLTLCEFLN